MNQTLKDIIRSELPSNTGEKRNNWEKNFHTFQKFMEKFRYVTKNHSGLYEDSKKIIDIANEILESVEHEAEFKNTQDKQEHVFAKWFVNFLCTYSEYRVDPNNSEKAIYGITEQQLSEKINEIRGLEEKLQNGTEEAAYFKIIEEFLVASFNKDEENANDYSTFVPFHSNNVATIRKLQQYVRVSQIRQEKVVTLCAPSTSNKGFNKLAQIRNFPEYFDNCVDQYFISYSKKGSDDDDGKFAEMCTQAERDSSIPAYKFWNNVNKCFKITLGLCLFVMAIATIILLSAGSGAFFKIAKDIMMGLYNFFVDKSVLTSIRNISGMLMSLIGCLILCGMKATKENKQNFKIKTWNTSVGGILSEISNDPLEGMENLY
ncbi:MAG: hypothetical protein COB50_00805 [Thiotrichales bacterium]|nr:MAG: hypothetical protein COB50_00805 [Thiotrichales bacterium]